MKLKSILLTGFLTLVGHFAQAQCTAYGYFTQSGATVTFYDTSYSVNNHDSYWSFGDGTSGGYGTPVSHTYTSNGTYTATLYIYDSLAICDDTTYFTVTISSLSSCNATFTHVQDSSNILKYYFYGSNPPAGGSVEWFVSNSSSGTSYTTQNITHTFSSVGTYSVHYILYDSSNNMCDSSIQSLTVSGSSGSTSACDAYFGAWVSGNTAYFYDSTTTSNIIEYTFGDGTYGYSANPTHTYANDGVYTACLFVYDVDSVGDTLLCDSFCQTFTISTAPACDATIGYAVDSLNTSASSYPVSFWHNSDTLFSFLWTFGDGTTSNNPNPNHVYSSAGTYTVCLNVITRYDSLGLPIVCDSSCTTVTVGSSVCWASYDYDSIHGLFHSFINTGSLATGYLWNFGDGTTDTVQNPDHTYASPGVYNVCLYLISSYDSLGLPVICDSICNTYPVNLSCSPTFTYTVDSLNSNKYYCTGSTPPSGGWGRFQIAQGLSTYFYNGQNVSHTFTGSGDMFISYYLYNSDSSICGHITTIIPSTNCSASFTYTEDSLNSNRYYFSGATPPSGGWATWSITEGSSNSTYTGQYATHTFAGSGNIYVLYSIYNPDSTLCNTDSANITLSGVSCQASFYLGVDSTNLYNLYIITNSTGITSNTNYYWTFGDGSSSTAQYPTHQYSSFGLYNLCLTISDSASGCSSTYCDSIGLDSNGNLLKRDGFGISVVDEKDLLSVKEIDNIQNLAVYPNPTSGLLNVSMDAMVAENMQMTVLNNMGQVVLSETHTSVVGENKLRLDLSNQIDGLYFVQLKSGNKMKTLKVFMIR